MEKAVSIRCRRHKKRFNVYASWLKTSKWLCPHCYEMLSESDRKKYSPKCGEEPEVREAEPCKPTMIASKAKNVVSKNNVKKSTIKSCGLGDLIGNFLDKKHQNRKTHKEDRQQNLNDIDTNLKKLLSEPKEVRQRQERRCFESKGFESEFEKLKPNHKVHCLKCGQDYPCFSFWFNTSKVLCPECASSMTAAQIEAFNNSHRCETLLNEVNKNEIKQPSKHSSDISFNETQFPDDSEAVLYGGGSSEYFIKHATPSELVDAVKYGRVSRTRARIELRRRKNADYFNDLPETEEVQLGRLR